MRFASLGATLALTALCGAPALAARLHPGDTVDVQVYNHPELSGTRTLDASGFVSLPLAGSVRAEGLEPEGLARAVQTKLATYVRHAAVDVRLNAQTASIFVSGGAAGTLKYEPGETLTSVVDRLTVQTPVTAPETNVQTVSLSATESKNSLPSDLFNGPQNFHAVSVERDGTILGTFDVVALLAAGSVGPQLHPGDTIVVGHKPVAVTVGGAVAKPVTAYLNPDEPLQQAIVQAGGIDATGSQDGILLARAGNVQRISAGSAALAAPAQNGDALTVQRAPRVDVLGEVKKPGDTYLRGDATLVSAIYYAGGPAEFANLKNVELIHAGVRRSFDITALQHGGTSDNPSIVDGDIVFVSKGSTFRLSDVWQALGSLGLFGLRL